MHLNAIQTALFYVKKTMSIYQSSNIPVFLVKLAVAPINGNITFYPFDLNKYNNAGASSMLKINFVKNRSPSDSDYNIPNPQKEICVPCTRLDTYMETNNIVVDLLCIDLQGYELNALKSMGSQLNNVKYIITECSIDSTYTGGTSFYELYEYLKMYNFKYICSNKFKYDLPPTTYHGFNEFDALFINTQIS